VIAPTAAPPQPPAIVQPAAYQASFGLVTGTVGPGTARIRVRVGSRLVADRPLRGRRFSLRIDLPPRDVVVRVTAVGAGGARRTSSVGPVLGLPRVAEPRAVASHADPALSRTVRRLAAGFHGTSGIYVQSLLSGAGAAWNAKARFPAASTLKLAIALAVLAGHDGVPPPGSWVDGRLHAMLWQSDNAAANELEASIGGSHRVDALLQALGLRDTIMYGGYETNGLRTPQGFLAFPAACRQHAETTVEAGSPGREPSSAGGARPIPIRVESQPRFGLGKYTTAWDLARLWRDTWQAAGGRGPIASAYRGAITAAEARYLLRLLALVGDRGKLDRFLAAGDVVLHKAGWLSTGRHDAGLILWPGGAVLATVLTWSPYGVGGSSDVLAGRVAKAARLRFAG
jgi:beta-lactamase class A